MDIKRAGASENKSTIIVIHQIRHKTRAVFARFTFKPLKMQLAIYFFPVTFKIVSGDQWLQNQRKS